MSVLVDTSVWIEYFRNGNNLEKLDFLIDENIVLINDLILSELVPFLRIGKQRKIIELLSHVNKLTLRIGWDQISEFQYQCLKSGLNGVGIPDLIIAQNAKQNHSQIYSLDNHFNLLEKIIKIRTYK
ncbi:MAG: PIN domain-containing protein [Deltaproteobacteria bacterium]|nr:PIN domain-containing protein [Deltaproteobacteria bacterium]